MRYAAEYDGAGGPIRVLFEATSLDKACQRVHAYGHVWYADARKDWADGEEPPGRAGCTASEDDYTIWEV